MCSELLLLVAVVFPQDLTALSGLFSPGMVVRCVVSRLGATKTNRHSLKLSINPKEVNAALSAGALRAGMVSEQP